MNSPIRVVKAEKSAGARLGDSANANEHIAHRRSAELVIGLCGPIGCGISSVIRALENKLRDWGYEVENIKVSTLLQETAKSLLPDFHPEDREGSAEFLRIWRLQDLGNHLRQKLGDDVGAQLAVKAISLTRMKKFPNQSPEAVIPNRTVYLIDQLKHPQEARLLQGIYGNLFFMIGSLCGYEQRKKNLGVEPGEAELLIQRDKEEKSKDGRRVGNGQQLEKTLKLADFFVRNSHQNTKLIERSLERFLDLVHGFPGSSPTRHECGMYAAYTAGLRSVCLSRQVGAAILSPAGNLIATGCNEVPKAGGGQYEEGSQPDHRCVNLSFGKCFNDDEKNLLRDEINRVLIKSGVDATLARKCADEIRTGTRLGDLIEFSRAVHAEMDAITKVAREGGRSLHGAFLYTTTYPCHNCARHIVAAGIRAVYFVEPYEKSLAEKLHADAIDHEPQVEPEWSESNPFYKVAFIHFEGVAPHRFASLFLSKEDRKDKTGKAIRPDKKEASIRDPEYLDDYRELEIRVVQRLDEKGAIPSV